MSARTETLTGHRARRGAVPDGAVPETAAPIAMGLILARGLILALALMLPFQPGRALGQSESLLDRISNQRMAAYEERLTNELNTHMTRYISRRQYVLSVKVVWSPDIIPAIDNPELTRKQQKLPGFPIFVRSPDSPAMEGGTPPFIRLEVRALIDETLPEYYERFVRKLIPIVARMDFNRGDQVVVLKETFPELPVEEEQPPTLPEKELMQQLGEAPPPGMAPQRMAPMPPPVAVPYQQAPVFAPQTAQSPAEAAQIAYDEGRLKDALRIVQSAFQRATSNRERSFFLGMEGSIYYTMQNTEAARASWRRAVAFDASNLEVHQALNYIEAPQQKESQ